MTPPLNWPIPIPRSKAVINVDVATPRLHGSTLATAIAWNVLIVVLTPSPREPQRVEWMTMLGGRLYLVWVNSSIRILVLHGCHRAFLFFREKSNSSTRPKWCSFVAPSRC